jgi:hypothetical protein
LKKWATVCRSSGMKWLFHSHSSVLAASYSAIPVTSLKDPGYETSVAMARFSLALSSSGLLSRAVDSSPAQPLLAVCVQVTLQALYKQVGTLLPNLSALCALRLHAKRTAKTPRRRKDPHPSHKPERTWLGKANFWLGFCGNTRHQYEGHRYPFQNDIRQERGKIRFEYSESGVRVLIEFLSGEPTRGHEPRTSLFSMTTSTFGSDYSAVQLLALILSCEIHY